MKSFEKNLPYRKVAIYNAHHCFQMICIHLYDFLKAKRLDDDSKT